MTSVAAIITNAGAAWVDDVQLRLGCYIKHGSTDCPVSPHVEEGKGPAARPTAGFASGRSWRTWHGYAA